MDSKIPQNGRIVIVDDRIDEALPLISLFSKNGAPVTYFNGQMDELPETPLKDVRIVFMDLRLSQGKLETKTIVSSFVSIIKRLISPNNGPFVLFLWSKHDADYLPNVTECFQDVLKKLKPTILLNMDKGSLLIEEDGELKYSLSGIEERLKTELARTGALELFILWENLVHLSAAETVSAFSSLYDTKDDWIKNMPIIFKALVKSRIGKNYNNATKEQIFTEGLCAFNGAFLDYLEKNISECNFQDVNMMVPVQEELNDLKIQAKINTRLHLQSVKFPHVPGTLYRYDEQEKSRFFGKYNTFISECIDMNLVLSDMAIDFGLDLKQLYANSKKLKPVFEMDKREFIESLTPILLEVSPGCDFAQQKWTVHRLLPGLAVPYYYFKFIRRSDYLMPTPPFEINETIYGFVFDLRYLTSLPLSEFAKIENMRDMCVFRQELISLIQTNLGRHVSRLGIPAV